MISLGLLGVLQALLLPGFALAYVLAPDLRRSLRDVALFAVPLSVVANYAVVQVLTALALYTQPVMLSVAALSAAAAFACVMHHRGSASPPPQAPPVEEMQDQILRGITIASIAMLVWRNLGTVFTDWDAVVAWNAWAENWFNQAPTLRTTQPQGLPILFSIVYKCAGTSNLQTIAKLLSMAFPVWGVACLWRIGAWVTESRREAIAAALFWLCMVIKVKGANFVVSGYADPKLAAFSAFAVYALAVWQQTRAAEPRVRERMLIVLAIALSAGAVIKLSGALLAPLAFAALIFIDRPFARAHVRAMATAAAAVGVIALHWFALAHGGSGAEFESGGYPVRAPALSALEALAVVLGEGVSLCTIIALVVNNGARITVAWFVLPLIVAWAVMGFEASGSMTFLAFIAAVAGVGLVWTTDGLPGKRWLRAAVVVVGTVGMYERLAGESPAALVKLVVTAVIATTALMIASSSGLAGLWRRHAYRRATVTVAAFAMALALVALPGLMPDQRLLAANTERRLEANDVGFNRMLSGIFANDSSSRVMSCWQLPYNIPGARGRFLKDPDCTIRIAQRWMDTAGVSYFLYYRGDPAAARLPEVRKLFAARGFAVAETGFRNDRWVLFKRLD